MVHTQEEIKKVYSFVGSNNLWDLTENEEMAKQDTTYTLATIDELHFMVAGCGYTFKGKIQTADGIVQWYEEINIDEHGFEDCIFEYRFVS